LSSWLHWELTFEAVGPYIFLCTCLWSHSFRWCIFRIHSYLTLVQLYIFLWYQYISDVFWLSSRLKQCLLLKLLFNKFLHFCAGVEFLPCRLCGLYEFSVITILLLLGRKNKFEFAHVLSLELIPLLDLLFLHFLFFFNRWPWLALDWTFLEFYLFLLLILLFFGKRKIQEAYGIWYKVFLNFEIKWRVGCKGWWMINFENPRF